MKKYIGLIDKYRLYKKKLYDNTINEHNNNDVYNINNNNKINNNKVYNIDGVDNKDRNNIELRGILGDYLDFSHYPAGEYSYPGPDITFTAPKSNPMVICLGCMSNIDSGDNINISWPKTQIPANFGTGSTGVNATVYTDDVTLTPVNRLPFYLSELGTPEYSDITFPNQTYASTHSPTSIGQPNTTTMVGDNQVISNQLGDGINTTLQTNATAGTYIDGANMTLSAIANNYATVNLSQEGILWTLWPLVKPKRYTPVNSKIKTTYFNDFKFGTATASNYQIGQFGYFYNNVNTSCIPMGSELSFTTEQSNPRIDIGLDGQIGINSSISSYIADRQSNQQINPGIQGLYRTLLISTDQLLAVLVVKVSEEIARIPNPASGFMSADRFIYVGYDGWVVIRTSANPVGPMIGQTHISPQTVTGSVTKENYQVIFPPNFFNQVFYKNADRIVPVDTGVG